MVYCKKTVQAETLNRYRLGNTAANYQHYFSDNPKNFSFS